MKNEEVMPQELKKLLEKQQYRFVGNHTAVKICEWNKKSIREPNKEKPNTYRSRF